MNKSVPSTHSIALSLTYARLIAGYAENGGNVVTGYKYDIAFCEPWFNTQTLDDAWKVWKDSPKEDIAMEYLEVGLPCSELAPS